MLSKESSSQKTLICTHPRLMHFPIMMFAIVMGLSGLTLMYQKAALWLGFPSHIATILTTIDTLIFTIISLTYFIKLLLYPNSVKAEITHPVRLNFFAAFSISLLLLASIYHEINLHVATVFWYFGAVFQTFFTFYTISFWFNQTMDIQHSNPAWFIPIVGNVIVPIGGFGIVDTAILLYFFCVGIFFWVIFLAIIINRIIFHHQLAEKFLPTLFIFIAPPAIGMVSYVKITAHFDLFANFLYNIGLFFTLLLLFMGKNFTKLKFFISWWAFTFPLAAMSIASLLAYHHTKSPAYAYISYGLIWITTSIVMLVGVQTVRYIRKKEICIVE